MQPVGPRQTLEWLQPLINTEAWIFRSVTSVSMAIYEDWFLKNSLEIDMLGAPSDDADTFNLLLTVGIEHKF